ncbi:peptidylprolyl isomerase [Gorillibacterium sp. sgz5001074]|uniref:peptidylprolyl isomerase n=1 Tax=Gorillibacterium sp. sgz5001074 TaxID=3446695 RepID=UPI003F681F85
MTKPQAAASAPRAVQTVETKPGSRIWMITSIALFVALAAYVIAVPPGQGSKEETVAKVNGTSISKTALYDALVAAGGSQTLQNLISEELVKQESDKAGIKITDADLEKEMADIKKNFSSDEQFQAALTQYNMTLDKLKADMTVQAQLRKLLEPQVKVTDDDVKKYYDENLESLKTPEQVRASHILVKTKEEAETVLADLKKGGDFAAIAKEKSLDPGSKEQGGDLNFFSKGMMEEPFETAAFALKVGELSSVVETSNGFHVIKLTDHKDAATPTLDQKKDELHEKLVSEQISTLSSSWIQEKTAAASIQTFLK